MSESRARAVNVAGDVAQWTAQLLAWLWLGQQGMRLGWPVASGVLAVAVWWAARVLCRGTPWAFRCPSLVVGGLGALTALGLALPEAFSSQTALLALAAVWGVWSALIETRSQSHTFTPGRLAWPPVLAAGLLALVWAGVPGVALNVAVSAVLLLCAGVLFVRDRQAALRARACNGAAGGLQHVLAPSAMGLMMGTLWLGHDWCMGPGWSTGQAVAAHVALMAGLPALVACVLRERPGVGGSPARRDVCSMVLMALGAVMWLGTGTVYGVLAMLLPSVAWALHCNRKRLAAGPSARMSGRVQRGLALCFGPVLLVGVGLVSPQQGPLAMQWAMAWLGGLAGVWLAVVSLHAATRYVQEHAVSSPAPGATAWPGMMK